MRRLRIVGHADGRPDRFAEREPVDYDGQRSRYPRRQSTISRSRPDLDAAIVR
jgi:hypothetical protein